MRLADAADLELFHGVGYFFLPLGASIVANGIHGLVSLAILFPEERLLDVERFFESGASGGQLSLRAGERAARLLELGGEGSSDIVAPGLDGGAHLGCQVGDIV